MALLSNPRIDQAADSAGIGRTTLFRWLQDETFRAAYDEARQRAFGGAVARLQEVSTDAVDTLHRNLRCGKPMVEVRAATSILELALQAVEVQDMERRLEELECALEASRDRRYA